MLTVPFQKVGNNYYFTPQTHKQLNQFHLGLGLHYDNDIIPKPTYKGFLQQIIIGLPYQYQIQIEKFKNPYVYYIQYSCSEFTIYHYPRTNNILCVLTEKQYQHHLNYLSSLNS